MIRRALASWSAASVLALSLLCIAPAAAYAGDQAGGQSDPAADGSQQPVSQPVGEAPEEDGAQAAGPQQPAVQGGGEAPAAPAAGEEPAGQAGPSGQSKLAAQSEPSAQPKLAAQAEPPAQAKLAAQESAPSASLSIRAHVQNVGDQKWSSGGASEKSPASAGTTGQALRMESVEIKLSASVGGSVQYQAHVQNDGWQEVKADGRRAGTTGRALRVEGIRIALVGEVSRYYDVYYRVHIQNKGWQQGWRKNGEYAGTTGEALRLEKIEVYLKKKEQPASSQGGGIVDVRAQAHVQNEGWGGWTHDGGAAGTTGRGLRVEALRIELDPGKYKGSVIKCNAHVQNKGWRGDTTKVAGTTGEGLRMEAVRISLEGDIAKDYDVVYRAHVQNLGWQPWTLNGGIAGTTGRALRVEAVQVKLVKKGSSQSLSEGTYFITVARDIEKNLANASLGSGNQTQIASFNSGMTERYYLRNEGGGVISLQSVNTGLFLASSGGNVVQLGDSSANSHRWKLSSWDGGYTITSAAGGSMAVSGSKATVGASGAKWVLSSTSLIPDGTYKVRNAAKGMRLDVVGAGFDNCTNVRVWSPNESGAQAYIFKNRGGNTFTIVNANSDMAVEVANASKANGANVRQLYQNGTAAQKWDASMGRAGGLVFTNRGSGKVLTVEGSGAEGCNVVSSDNRNSATQCWTLEPSSFVGNPAIPRAVRAVESAWSSTGYAIVVDLTNHWLCIFTGRQGNWSLYKNWQVSNGQLSMPTVTGDYEVGIKGYSFGSGYTCYYYTQIWGDYLFHSAMYREGTFELMDGPLGVYSTHGCVRMDINNAKWIYDNIPAGTKIRIYN